MRGWLALVSLAAATACSSNDDEVDRRKCEQLRDHLVEVRLTQLTAQPDPAANPTLQPTHAPPPQPVNLEAHRAAMKQALGEDFLGSCQKTLTVAQIKCALGAPNSATASTCISASASK